MSPVGKISPGAASLTNEFLGVEKIIRGKNSPGVEINILYTKKSPGAKKISTV